MRKYLLGLACALFLATPVAIAQTTAPAKADPPKPFVWDDFGKQTTLESQFAWLEANVPTMAVMPYQRAEWAIQRAKVMYDLDKINDAVEYMKELDAGATKVGIRRDSDWIVFTKATVQLYTFQDYAAAKKIGESTKKPSVKNEILFRVADASGDKAGVVIYAPLTGRHFDAFKALRDTPKVDYNKTDKLFELVKVAMSGVSGSYQPAPNEIRQMMQVLFDIKIYDGATVTTKQVIELFRSFKIPPANTPNDWMPDWGKLAGDIDLQVQLFEVEIAKQAAAKKDTAAK